MVVPTVLAIAAWRTWRRCSVVPTAGTVGAAVREARVIGIPSPAARAAGIFVPPADAPREVPSVVVPARDGRHTRWQGGTATPREVTSAAFLPARSPE